MNTPILCPRTYMVGVLMWNGRPVSKEVMVIPERTSFEDVVEVITSGGVRVTQ